LLRKILAEMDPVNIRAVIGFDGFIDEIIHVVKTRNSIEEYIRIKTIKEYGERIIKAAGLSTNIELIPVQVKLGGNGPIMSKALIEYGVDVTYIGALGLEKINPVFQKMADRCRVISIADPAHTDALEFEDGKLMMGKMESLKDINWGNIKQKIGIKRLISLFQEINLLGLANWTMIPYMNEIWKGIIKEVLPLLEVHSLQNRIAFFDLADPEKRTREDIKQALNLIKGFSPYFKVILGLNQKEAKEIAGVLDLDIIGLTLRELIEKLAEELNIYCLVIHPVNEAVAYSEGNYYHTEGPFTANPKITTGAGDNFNAGFCLGQSLGLTIQDSLLLGVATSGYYVRKAESPTLKDIIKFLDECKLT
jgi:fructose-1-phosphate kinase PfkB-like protein